MVSFLALARFLLVLLLSSFDLAFSIELAGVLNPEDISLPPRDPRSQSVDSYCRSFQFSVASGNLLSWRVPAECVPYVRSYTTGPQYQADVQAATSLALQQAQTFCARPGIDAWLFDVDGTLLSTTPYFATKQFGAGSYNDTDFNLWAARGVAPAIVPVRTFYRTLLRTNWTVFLVSTRPESLRRATVRNLLRAGYRGWKRLFMRRPLFQTQDENLVEIKKANKLSRGSAEKSMKDAGYDTKGATSNKQDTGGDKSIPQSQVPDLSGNK
ncbi:acid phosphatase 1 [Selaginella moellendorffii]|uniref:acid phosphatase 1 n=1 Tax=Selaginella moellendorffii TaxID=88036 RepID=UPI000D1CCCAC|nr:acid phosphatase 1 [Selaginella moellendorffii]|eukprot:XP_002980410.2 acid phosphatase 1 [Selaginella moellendorffii]